MQKINNTIFQTAGFNTSCEKVFIDGNEVFYKKEGKNILISAHLLSIEQFKPIIFDYFFLIILMLDI